MTIYAERTNILGLWDLTLPDGRELFDMTTGQARYIAWSNGWSVQFERPLERT